MKHIEELPYQLRRERDFSGQEKELLERAESALLKAHAPYSGFQVGCSLQLRDGTVYSGNNQENAAYPSGLCAERVALFKARSESDRPIDLILVIAKDTNGNKADAFSCGSCRQVMVEYASMQKDPIRILMQDRKGRFIEVNDVRLLLPFNFDSGTIG